MQVNVIRSVRKTITLQVEKDLSLTVKVPEDFTEDELQDILRKKKPWIEAQVAKLQRRTGNAAVPKMTEAERQLLRHRAALVFISRVTYWAPIIGVHYTDIQVRTQRTCWGSVNSKGVLSFNALLFLAPPEVLDSVVVHELCHLKVMDHSGDFYNLVLSYFPSYPQTQAWLKENGPALIDRLP